MLPNYLTTVLSFVSKTWLTFKIFLDQFLNRNPLQFLIAIRLEQVIYVPLTKKQHTFAHFSFTVFVLHTFYCFLRLMWLWKTGLGGSNENLNFEIIRIYLLIFFTFLPLSCSAMGFVLAKRFGTVVAIMNSLRGLTKFAHGNNQFF